MKECWRELDGQNKGSRWEEERKEYYEDKGINVKEVRAKCTDELRLAEELAQINREKQAQEQYDRIITGKYNKMYREIRESEREVRRKGTEQEEEEEVVV